MPNQRKQGLKLVGAFVTQKQVDRLKSEARRRGMTVADLVRQLVETHLAEPNEQQTGNRGNK